VNYIRAGILLLVVGLVGCGKGSHDPAVVARVNGRNILQADVDRQFRLQTQAMPQKPSGDAANLLKLDILRQLIVEEIMLQKAEELKLQLADSEVEAELASLKGNATPEEFKKTIAQRGWNEEDLRKEIRRNLTMQKLAQSQLSSKTQLSPEEISRYYEENKNRFYVQELEYHIGQIVFLAKHYRSTEWQSLSIPKNRSAEFNQYLSNKSSLENKHHRFDVAAKFGEQGEEKTS